MNVVNNIMQLSKVFENNRYSIASSAEKADWTI